MYYDNMPFNSSNWMNLVEENLLHNFKKLLKHKKDVEDTQPDLKNLEKDKRQETITKTESSLLESLFVTENRGMSERVIFEEFIKDERFVKDRKFINDETFIKDNKKVDDLKKIKFLWILNKLIENNVITISNIVDTIKLIDEDYWYGRNTNVFFCCLLIEKFLSTQGNEIDLSSLESLVGNKEFTVKLTSINSLDTQRDIRKDIRSAIDILKRRSSTSHDNKPQSPLYGEIFY